jgi:hypothetical protein
MEAAQAQNRAPHYEERPWGSFKVLDEGNGYKGHARWP